MNNATDTKRIYQGIYLTTKNRFLLYNEDF